VGHGHSCATTKLLDGLGNSTNTREYARYLSTLIPGFPPELRPDIAPGVYMMTPTSYRTGLRRNVTWGPFPKGTCSVPRGGRGLKVKMKVIDVGWGEGVGVLRVFCINSTGPAHADFADSRLRTITPRPHLFIWAASFLSTSSLAGHSTGFFTPRERTGRSLYTVTRRYSICLLRFDVRLMKNAFLTGIAVNSPPHLSCAVTGTCRLRILSCCVCRR